jgi:zinc transport system permease protein
MLEMLDLLKEYFAFPFVQRAMIVGVLIALCSSLLGVTLVLKRFSFIGSGLSHVAFGATPVAALLSISAENSIFFVLPVTVICAILLLRTGQNAKIKGDASVAMISAGTLGVGYLLMSLFPQSTNFAGDVCTILFGSTSILTIKTIQVWASVILSLLVIAVFVLFYHKIFAVTFDEGFSSATGVRAKMYNLILAVVIAVIIVVAMNLVGALLISALVIFPALSAMRVFKTFLSVTICSVIFSVVCAALGIIISIIADTPVGSTIVAVDIAGFLMFSLIGLITKRG